MNRLNRHKKVHTNEKPFSCAHCEYKCTEKYNLDRHIKTHHSQTKVEVHVDPSQTNLEATKLKEGEEEKEADEVEENEEPDLEQPGPSQEIRVEEPIAGSSQSKEPIKLDNEKWKCPYCAYSTNRRRDVNRHIKLQHLSNR